MEKKLDFSLPEKKRAGSIGSKIAAGLLIIIAGASIANLFIGLSARRGGGESILSAEQTKELAVKLAARNLYDRAAEVWQEYVRQGGLSGSELAGAYFQIGTLLEKQGEYAEAIEYFYRSESAAKVDELGDQINSHIKDCFERLGKFSALRYELIDRTSFKKSPESGDTVVAEIGPEKITSADLDAMIEKFVDSQLNPLSAFMTAEQILAQKKQMLERFMSAESRYGFLEMQLGQEILYRQALEEGLSEKGHVKAMIEDVVRAVLSQQMMNEQMASRIHITDSDVQMYYAANKDKFVEPAKAKISHISVPDAERAKFLLGELKDGKDFAELAGEFSKDDDTAGEGGKIEGEIVKGGYIPVIGKSDEINQAIFAAAKTGVIERYFETDEWVEIINVDEFAQAREKSFEEVRQDAMAQLLNQKRMDVQQMYMKQMMDKYNVAIHISAVRGSDYGQSEQQEAEEQR